MTDSWKIFGITVMVMLIGFTLFYVFVYLSRECNSHNDCSSDEVCAVNHQCVPLSKDSRTGILSPLILAGAMIGAAYIIKKGKDE